MNRMAPRYLSCHLYLHICSPTRLHIARHYHDKIVSDRIESVRRARAHLMAAKMSSHSPSNSQLHGKSEAAQDQYKNHLFCLCPVWRFAARCAGKLTARSLIRCCSWRLGV